LSRVRARSVKQLARFCPASSRCAACYACSCLCCAYESGMLIQDIEIFMSAVLHVAFRACDFAACQYARRRFARARWRCPPRCRRTAMRIPALPAAATRYAASGGAESAVAFSARHDAKWGALYVPSDIQERYVLPLMSRELFFRVRPPTTVRVTLRLCAILPRTDCLQPAQ